MNKLSLPYLRMFFLLTLAFGLMGNAKLLLAYKAEKTKVTLTSQLKKPSTKHDLVRIKISPKQPIKSPITKSAREKLTRDFLDTFANISNESVAKEEQVASVNTKQDNKEKPDQQTLTNTKLPIFSKQANTSALETSQELLSATNLSEMPSIELLKKLEASMQKQTVSKSSKRSESPIIANRIFSNTELAYQAELRLQSRVTYDGRYLKISYPMGDVPSDMGVCTDVVIRSLRGLGIDLQQRVHEDMKRHFRSYPNKWQLSRPDSNIDHRRVPNLMTYFKRIGASLPISNISTDYHPGNIVAWEMGNGMTHIGIVSTSVSPKTGNPLIVHNIGVGPELSDILFDFKIIGHYKYGDNRDPSIHLAKVF